MISAMTIALSLSSKSILKSNSNSFRHLLARSFHSAPKSLPEIRSRLNPWPRQPWIFGGVAVAAVGLGVVGLNASPIYCESRPTTPVPSTQSNSANDSDDLPSPPRSSVDVYELTFGTVAGICAGVFVKKGAKALAWFFGGIFVLLQYLGHTSIVRVDWSKVSSKFENIFYKKDVAGNNKPPTVGSVFHWLINFLTADFQPRATFIAGFILGLRVG